MLFLFLQVSSSLVTHVTDHLAAIYITKSGANPSVQIEKSSENYLSKMYIQIALLSLLAMMAPVVVSAGYGHSSHGIGTACIVKGSYCQCHYCKCEHGHIHCKGHGHGGGYGKQLF